MADSTVTNRHSESNFVQNDYDLGKRFVRNNRYQNGTFQNNTGAAAAFPAGTIVAKNTSTGNLVPWDNTVTTNSQNIPVGILRDDVPSLAAAATATNVWYAIAGDVAEEKIVFTDGGQDMDTVITLVTGLTQRVRDYLHNIGIIPVPTRDITTADNS